MTWKSLKSLWQNGKVLKHLFYGGQYMKIALIISIIINIVLAILLIIEKKDNADNKWQLNWFMRSH